MTYAPVGIRCPDHATTGGKAAAPRQAARRASQSISLSGPIVTFTLIGDQRRRLRAHSSRWAPASARSGLDLRRTASSYGPAVAPTASGGGLITAPFLHYGLLHLGMNMLVLWFIGPVARATFGTDAILLVYFVSGLAGSAGALLWSPERPHRRRLGRDLRDHGRARSSSRRAGSGSSADRRWGSSSSTSPSRSPSRGSRSAATSAGSSGERLCALAFSSFRRSPALATLSIAAIGVLSVGVAVAQVG